MWLGVAATLGASAVAVWLLSGWRSLPSWDRWCGALIELTTIISDEYGDKG